MFPGYYEIINKGGEEREGEGPQRARHGLPGGRAIGILLVLVL